PSIAIHPAGVFPFDGWFASSGSLVVDTRRGDTVEVVASPGTELRPAAPLTAWWPCSRLTTNPFRASEQDVVDAFNLGRDLQAVTSSSHPIPLRATPRGPTVAWLDARDVRANVVARDALEVRVRFAVDGAWVVAWADASAFNAPYISPSR